MDRLDDDDELKRTAENLRLTRAFFKIVSRETRASIIEMVEGSLRAEQNCTAGLRHGDELPAE